MIRIVVVDDQPLIRLGLRVLIETEDDLQLAGEAGEGPAALSLVRRVRPDVALLDIRMPGLDGLEVLKAIVADPVLAATRVVIVTTFALDEYLFEALRAGASGFIVKDTDPAELLRAIRVVAAGESLLSPTMTRRLIGAFTARPALHAPDLSDLTAREREITALAGHGLSNDEIAGRLVISPATARTHVSRAMIKLGARDRAQLVVLAHQAGLVTPPE
ncbi:MAG: response regulator [Mycobacteriales bacterium]|nr:MAG: DNA-binding response regulator [Pseudonocardiales bacterium]